MKILTGIISFLLLSFSAFGFSLNSATKTAITDGSRNDVAAAISDASVVDGWTVAIPAGSFTWTSGVTISGKGIKLKGAKGGKIEGSSSSSMAVGTGSKTFTTQAGLDWQANETIRVVAVRTGASMTGTVTNYSGTSLQVNVTSTSGSGTPALWVFEQDGATTLTFNTTAGIVINKDSTHSVEVSDLDIIRGNTTAVGMISINGNGEPAIVHDIKVSMGDSAGKAIYCYANGALVYRVDAHSSYGWGNFEFRTVGFMAVQFGGLNATWQATDTMGAADTSGKNNIYVEECDFIGLSLEGFDFSDNAKIVVRDNRFVHTAITSHGPDTGQSGLRHFEIYRNTFRFQGGAGNCANTLVMDYLIFIRGGVGIIANNAIDDVGGSCLGDKPEIKFQLQAPWRNGGPYPCWSKGWPIPHQHGRNWNGSAEVTDPIYIWGNSGDASQTPSLASYGNECGSSGASQSLSDYLKSGRDYVAGSARPGYAFYTFPHPLRSGSTPAQTPPVIAANPQNAVSVQGQSVSFTVSATGAAPLSYQWQKNQANIAGATAATYTISSSQAADAGSYRCVVTNSLGSVTSSAATLTVTVAQPPSITTQPVSQTRLIGQSAEFSIVATGGGPLSYQWQRNSANIAGATSASYTIASVQTSNAGTYRCLVSNAAGTATSTAATLTVNAPPVAPSITAQPQSLTRSAGQSATFTITAAGDAPLAYQWQKGSANIAGSTAASLTIANVQTSDAGSYRCVVTNAAGAATSDGATLTVNTPQAPAITANPQALTRTEGQGASFTVTATGTGPLSYQWQKNTVNISGANAATFNIAAVQTSDAGNYRCIVSNSVSSATSSAAALTVNPAPAAPAFTASPQPLTRNPGESATFSVTCTGTAPLVYQWQKDGANIGGATSSSLVIASVAAADAGSYRCVVSNVAGSATSSAATLTVNAPPSSPVITVGPQSLVRTVGQTATFSVTATGTAPLIYQWQKGQVNISGATSANLTFSNAQEADSGNYRCVVSNAVGSATSTAASLTVNPAPAGPVFYVDETAGNDSNPGTQSEPWKRSPGMVGWTGSATLQPGTTVYFDRSDTWNIAAHSSGAGFDLKAGVHYIGDEWDPESVGSGRAIIRATGRHEAGVVRFWEDHATFPTWLDGFEIDANGQRANLIDINHAFWRAGLTKGVKRIENCVAHGNTGNGGQGDYKYGIIVSDHSSNASGQVSNVEILNTVVYNTPRDGICLYPGNSGRVSNVIVRGCEVYGTGTDPSYGEGHGLVIKGDVRNSVFEYCYVHDVNSSAVFITGPENGSGVGPSNCVIRHSVLQTADDNGVIRFYGPGSKSADIIGNVVLENEATGGLSFSGNSGTIAARIYNNTFYDAFVDIGNPTSTGTIEFKNNLIYEVDDVCLTDTGSDITSHSNNLFFRANSGTRVRIGSTNYSTPNVTSWEPTAKTGNPQFKNPSNLPNGFTGSYGSSLAPNHDGLSLLSNSPALNAAADLGTTYNGSINSRSRPIDAGWDIGAYEGIGAVPPTAPSKLRIIGP